MLPPHDASNDWEVMVRDEADRTGPPLESIKVLEFAGLGPGPFAAMMLGDMGANVVRVERAGGDADYRGAETLLRNRTVIELDLKSPTGRQQAVDLATRADVLIEGFRPGVMERLGLGPEVFRAANPGLIYGRATGWGRSGPRSSTAGHDINYIALTGALAAIGEHGGPPIPPLNLLGDFGGGGGVLAFGIAVALFERSTSGRGQVVDAAMVDGVHALMARFHGLRAAGRWEERRGRNRTDGGYPFYACYPCADGQYVAVGCLEEKFQADLLTTLGLPTGLSAIAADRTAWPEVHSALAAKFATRSRGDWDELFKHSDACVTPVLTLSEAVVEPANLERNAFRTVGGVAHPAPVPRFGRSRAIDPEHFTVQPQSAAAVLERWRADSVSVETSGP